MNHCSSLPATCTPPPLPASGPRTLLQSTRPLSASPPAHSPPHSIWHDALHPSPGHKVAIVALVRRASRPLAETASSLAAVDRPPAFQLPAESCSSTIGFLSLGSIEVWRGCLHSEIHFRHVGSCWFVVRKSYITGRVSVRPGPHSLLR